jgi:hypothetical protein
MGILWRCLNLSNIYKTEYESLRKNLNVIFDRETFKTKSDLEFLMKEYGLRYNKKWGNLRPSSKQLDLAWDYAKIKIGTKWEKVEVKEKIRYITVKEYSYKRNKKTIHVKSYKRRYKNV